MPLLAENIRTAPRISVNALTEYMHAAPSRRRQIIREQKRPKDFMLIYYQPAQSAIRQFIATGMDDDDFLLAQIDELYSRLPRNQYEEHRWPSNAEAIESFLEFYERVNLHDLKPRQAPTTFPKVRMSEIDLSVSPDILLTGSKPRYGNVGGALTLFFSKRENSRLDDESGKCPGALVFELMSRVSTKRKILHRACLVVDVFGQSVFEAPRSSKTVLHHIEAACEEISLRWPTA